MRGKLLLFVTATEVFLRVEGENHTKVALFLHEKYRTAELAQGMAKIIAKRMGLRRQAPGWAKTIK